MGLADTDRPWAYLEALRTELNGLKGPDSPPVDVQTRIPVVEINAKAAALFLAVTPDSPLSRAAGAIAPFLHLHGGVRSDGFEQAPVSGSECSIQRLGQGHVHGVVGGEVVAELEDTVEERQVWMPRDGKISIVLEGRLGTRRL